MNDSKIDEDMSYVDQVFEIKDVHIKILSMVPFSTWIKCQRVSTLWNTNINNAFDQLISSVELNLFRDCRGMESIAKLKKVKSLKLYFKHGYEQEKLIWLTKLKWHKELELFDKIEKLVIEFDRDSYGLAHDLFSKYLDSLMVNKKTTEGIKSVSLYNGAYSGDRTISLGLKLDDYRSQLIERSLSRLMTRNEYLCNLEELHLQNIMIDGFQEWPSYIMNLKKLSLHYVDISDWAYVDDDKTWFNWIKRFEAEGSTKLNGFSKLESLRLSKISTHSWFDKGLEALSKKLIHLKSICFERLIDEKKLREWFKFISLICQHQTEFVKNVQNEECEMKECLQEVEIYFETLNAGQCDLFSNVNYNWPHVRKLTLKGGLGLVVKEESFGKLISTLIGPNVEYLKIERIKWSNKFLSNEDGKTEITRRCLSFYEELHKAAMNGLNSLKCIEINCSREEKELVDKFMPYLQSICNCQIGLALNRQVKIV